MLIFDRVYCMKYLNPFHILDIEPSTLKGEASEVLKGLRQRLLAEFELHDTATLILQDKEVDKAAVLFLLSELENEAHRTHHAKIYASLGLRTFLEDGSLDLFETEIQEVFSDKDFATFIAPHFARQYNTRLYHLVKHQKLNDIERLANFKLPFPPKWIAQCYQDSYRFLVYQLKDAKSMDRKMSVVNTYSPILAILPDYFDTIRNMYAPYKQASDFASLTENFDEKNVKRVIWIGVGVAAAIALLTLIF